MFSCAYLPLDDRPCNTDYLLSLAKVAGVTVKLAENPPQFQDFLNDCDTAIFSLDRWIYGGLCQSREFELNLPKALERFRLLAASLTKHSGKNSYAFSVLLRESPNILQDSDLETASLIREASQSHRNRVQFGKILRKLPTHRWEKYLAVRQRNFEINQKALSLVKERKVSLLALGMDDLSAQGLNQKEYESLKKRIAKEKLGEQVPLLPGADEMGLLLFTRHCLRQKKLHPRIFPVYSLQDPKAWKSRYENLSLPEMVKRQVELLGGRVAPKESESDLILFLHTGETAQRDVPAESIPGASRLWLQQLNQSLKKNQKVILADLRFANGADADLMRRLAKNEDLLQLYGYSAWNTAANALGIALSQGVLRWAAEQTGKFSGKSKQEHFRFLALRFLEDWFYQAEIRPKLAVAVRKTGKSPLCLAPELQKNLGEKVRSQLEELAKTYLRFCFPRLNISSVRFPWNRLFDISLYFTI